jgi:hypothetical protein
MKLANFSLVLTGILIMASLIGLSANSLVNAQEDPLAEACRLNPNSSLCQGRDQPGKLTGQDNIFIRVAQLVVYITGIAAVIMIIIGGFTYVTSNGDSQRVNSAKNTILYAIIGIVVAISAQLIINFVLSRVGR